MDRERLLRMDPFVMIDRGDKIQVPTTDRDRDPRFWCFYGSAKGGCERTRPSVLPRYGRRRWTAFYRAVWFQI